MSGFGSFVGGLFEGAQFGMNLMKARNDLEIQTMTIAAAKKAQAAADADVAAGKPGVASGPVPDPTNPVPVEAPPQAKPALAPDKQPEPTKQPPVGSADLKDKIAPLVSQHESSNRPYVGYTPPDQLARGEGWTDLSKAPSKPGDYGFPDWAGAVNPETGQLSHAAGLYQIQPDKWRAYAPGVGVNDFSPESQKKVFDAIYMAEGTRPWNANRNLIAALGQANLLGGATAATTQAGPALMGPQQPSKGPPSSATAADAPKPPATPADKAKAAQQKAVSTITNAFGGATQTAQQKTEPVMPPTTSMAAIPSAPAAPAPRMAAAAPAADTVGQSMVSSPQASALGVAPPVSVQGPQRGAVLASLRQDTGGMQLPQQRPPQQRTFRMPNGTLVDGIGNIVRLPPQSALYPGTDNA